MVSNGLFLWHEAVAGSVIKECGDGGMFDLDAI